MSCSAHCLAIWFNTMQCSAVALQCTTLPTIKAYDGYQPCHRVLWINPDANITFLVITLETAGIQTVNPDVGRYSTVIGAVI